MCTDSTCDRLELDGIQSYASDVPSLWLLYMEFFDNVREVDRDRIILCWQFLPKKNFFLKGVIVQEIFLQSTNGCTVVEVV